MTQIAEQGQNNTQELMNMSGQITAVFAQLNNLQTMLSNALSQQQHQQLTAQHTAAATATMSALTSFAAASTPMEKDARTQQSSYGKGDGKAARVSAAGGLNHNLY